MSPETFQTLEIDRPFEGARRITLNRPPVNALSGRMVDELSHAVTSLEGDPGLRVVLLAARGRAFCAGADLKERRGMSDDEVLATVERIAALVDGLAAIELPTMAVISGAALGGGLELALGCDLRVASVEARIGLPECSLAIIPGAGGTQRLARLIGPARAKRWVFTAQVASASEALADGIVDLVTPAEQLEDEALRLARTIARCGPIALRAAKGAIDEGLAAGALEAGLAAERRHYARTIPTADRREALAAFAEKRPPRFIGA